MSSATISLAELNAGWETPAAALIAPLARAVGIGRRLSAQWLSGQAAG